MPTKKIRTSSPQIAAGSVVVVRDEEWLVSKTEFAGQDGHKVTCLGIGGLVANTEAQFFTELDEIQPLRPEETMLVDDDSPGYRRSRLFLESVVRKTPVPASESALATADDHLLNKLEYQRRPVKKALDGLQPRLLIADAVGLGKTLEIGLILSELIRRGRGERILVVTPRHILEQFQHELWTRFAIPLIRLDSEGIQRVRREIPANRNPFSFYKRAIISIDTLKNEGRYKHHLEGIRWDAVVIDECHNVVNSATLRGQLAKLLAPRTEALLLTSATPHNGKAESFADLINLLDRTAIADNENYDAEDIAELYVRRHKATTEVAAEVGSDWADRKDPMPIVVDANDGESAVFAELNDVWLYPADGESPTSGSGRSLFPWLLLKSFLSSGVALQQTIANRRKSIAASSQKELATSGVDVKGGPVSLSPNHQREDDALKRLSKLAEATDESSKLERLVDELKTIGVGPTSDTRVVVFSERVATLDWLSEVLPKRLKMKKNQVEVLHASLPENTHNRVIEQFGLADQPVRILLASDMASEGVNLHAQCHHLVHWDVPWSLIVIEQRNGRIDRYGQKFSPENRALLLVPQQERLHGEVRILARLLDKEHNAHRALGDAASLMGLHDVKAEEEAILKKLRDGVNVDDVVPDAPPEDSFDYWTMDSNETSVEPVPVSKPASLFTSERAFVGEALELCFDDPVSELDLNTEDSEDFLALTPPKDLKNLFRVLPKSYVVEQGVGDRLKLTTDPVRAEDALSRARRLSDSMWPDVGFLSPHHPLVSWLVDKVLVHMGRNEAPILRCNVETPTWLVQGVYSNARGQAQMVEWMAIPETADGLVVNNMFAALEAAGVGSSMPNRGAVSSERELKGLLNVRNTVIEHATAHLNLQRQRYDDELERRLAALDSKATLWYESALDLDTASYSDRKSRQDEKRKQEIKAAFEAAEALRASLRTAGQPLLRILGVLVKG